MVVEKEKKTEENIARIQSKFFWLLLQISLFPSTFFLAFSDKGKTRLTLCSVQAQEMHNACSKNWNRSKNYEGKVVEFTPSKTKINEIVRSAIVAVKFINKTLRWLVVACEKHSATHCCVQQLWPINRIWIKAKMRNRICDVVISSCVHSIWTACQSWEREHFDHYHNKFHIISSADTCIAPFPVPTKKKTTTANIVLANQAVMLQQQQTILTVSWRH